MAHAAVLYISTSLVFLDVLENLGILHKNVYIYFKVEVYSVYSVTNDVFFRI